MQLAEVVQVGQIVAVLGTLVAVGCSIYIANKARQEVREDRRLRTHPVVVMEPGGYVVPVSRKRFDHRIPGKDPQAVEDDFGHLPRSGLRIDSEAFGHLRNVGQGPALEVEVVFTPHKLKTGDAWLDLDDQMRSDPQYSPEWNTEVAINHVLLPGSETELSGLPCFVTLDFADEIIEAEGTIEITYKDLNARSLRTLQEFRYVNAGAKAKHRYILSFGDILEVPR